MLLGYTVVMSLRERLMRGYFDAVYSRLYDRSTARLSRYLQAQETLVRHLRVQAGQRVLCAGLGTGNELTSLRAVEHALNIVGIDLSRTALTRARRKPSGGPAGTALALMDARLLGFKDATFDRLLCYHVLDFTREPEVMAQEFLRVLRPGGRFVISFPSGAEGPGLGASLLSDGLSGPGRHDGRRTEHVSRTLLAGFIYLPLMLRHRPRTFTSDGVDALLRSLGAADVAICTDPVYRDHIAGGAKKGG